MARRPAEAVNIAVRPETAQRLREAAEERMVGHHLLADRLLNAALDDLPPVDAYGRPAAPPPRPMEPTVCLLDHECEPECPPTPQL